MGTTVEMSSIGKLEQAVERTTNPSLDYASTHGPLRLKHLAILYKWERLSFPTNYR